MSFLYITGKPPSNRRTYLWGSSRVQTPGSMPRYVTANRQMLCITYHYRQEGVIIVDEDTHDTLMEIPLTQSANGKRSTKQLDRACITDQHLYIADRGQVYKITFAGEVVCRFGTVDSTISCIAIGPDGLLYIGNYNRIANFQGVLVYHCNGNFSHVLCHDIQPVDIAFDQLANVHVCDGRSNSIKVYDSKGSVRMVYGQGYLQNPKRIAVHPDNFNVVLESVSLLVFNDHGDYLYEINLDQNGILDFTITSSGTLWLTDNYFNLFTQQSNAFFNPPASLKLLCQSAILLNTADLPTFLLPSKYSSVFKEWSRAVQYEFIGPGTDADSKIKGKLNIPVHSNGKQALAMILEEKLGVSYNLISRHLEYDKSLGKVTINLNSNIE